MSGQKWAGESPLDGDDYYIFLDGVSGLVEVDVES